MSRCPLGLVAIVKHSGVLRLWIMPEQVFRKLSEEEVKRGESSLIGGRWNNNIYTHILKCIIYNYYFFAWYVLNLIGDVTHSPTVTCTVCRDALCFPPVSQAASRSICASDRLGGDGKHCALEMQLWKPFQQLFGLRDVLVPLFSSGCERGAETGDHHPDLWPHRAGRLQSPSRGQGEWYLMQTMLGAFLKVPL